MDDWKGTILRAALPPLVFIALILKQPDLGTALVCAGVTALMLYLAGAQVALLLHRRRTRRWCALLHAASTWPLAARAHAGLHQSGVRPQGRRLPHPGGRSTAVGTGGLWGRGLMEGVQKLFYLPEPHTDFIFANICEELGLIGALAGRRALRGPRLSWPARRRALHRPLRPLPRLRHHVGDPDPGLLQQRAVVLALVPTKGITLPLISSGGTSVFITLASSRQVLLNITREID